MSCKLLFAAFCLAALSTAAVSAPNIAVTAAQVSQAAAVAVVGPAAADLPDASVDSSDKSSEQPKTGDPSDVAGKMGLKKAAAGAKRPRAKSKKRLDTSVVASKAGKLTAAQMDRARRLAHEALNYRGAPYVWGGNGRRGVFDCSGFTQYLYAKKGIRLPHSAKMQFGMGAAVDKSALKQGDLVFFNTERGPLTHVGMYLGNGVFIHAVNPHRGVATNRLTDTFYAARYAGARRYASG